MQFFKNYSKFYSVLHDCKLQVEQKNDFLKCFLIYKTAQHLENNPCHGQQKFDRLAFELAETLKNCSEKTGSKTFGTAVYISSVVFKADKHNGIKDSDDLNVVLSMIMVYAVLCFNASLSKAINHVDANIDFYLKEFNVDEPEHTRWDQFSSIWKHNSLFFTQIDCSRKGVDAVSQPISQETKCSGNETPGHNWTYTSHLITKNDTLVLADRKKIPNRYAELL